MYFKIKSYIEIWKDSVRVWIEENFFSPIWVLEFFESVFAELNILFWTFHEHVKRMGILCWTEL